MWCCRKLYNGEVHVISVSKWRKIIWSGHVAYKGKLRNAFRIVVEKPLWNSPLGGTRLFGMIILEYTEQLLAFLEGFFSLELEWNEMLDQNWSLNSVPVWDVTFSGWACHTPQRMSMEYEWVWSVNWMLICSWKL
jgi:hypothetical protein